MNLVDFYYNKCAWVKRLAVVLLLLGGACWILTGGYENKHIRYNGGISSLDSGLAIHCTSVFALKGQTISVDYDITRLDRGRLCIHIWNSWLTPLEKTQTTRYVEQPGTGRVELTVPDTGFYDVSCYGSSKGKGYDIEYSALWRARWL